MTDAQVPNRAARGNPALSTLLSLVLRNVLFTIAVPGLGGVGIPWWILTRYRAIPTSIEWYAVLIIASGAMLYVRCVWAFALVGRGTPGPWDAPRHFIAAGPYRWVRNPIYIAALVIVAGEAWLFLSWKLLAYAGAMAILFHLFVIGYEEPTLYRRFGTTYDDYRRNVPRWIPRRPGNAYDALAGE